MRLTAFAVLLGAVAAATGAVAQDTYPSRPITLSQVNFSDRFFNSYATRGS